MEPLVALTQPGQGVQDDEFNLICREASLSADWLLAELLRPAPSGSGDGFAPKKYIIPSGGLEIGYGAFDRKALVGSSGAADAKVYVQPFMAVIGSRSDANTEADALRQIRTARHYGETVPRSFRTEIQIPAATANPRWDLIWAKVDVEAPDNTVVRYTKVGNAAVGTTSVSLIKRTLVTIGRTQGTENVSPTRPTIPADSGNSYYIPLAYVIVGGSHNLTTQVSSVNIHEVYPAIQLAAPFGAPRVRPADSCWREDGATLVNAGWTSTNGRPPTHLPPGQQGADEITLPIAIADGTGSVNVPPNTATLLDRSVNWLKRDFELLIDVKTPASGQAFPWLSVGQGSTRLWTFTSTPDTRVAQSYANDDASLSTFTGTAVAAGFILFTLTDATSPFALATGAKFVLYVGTDGNIYAWRNNVDAARQLIVRVRGRGRFHNTDANGS